MTLAGLSSAQTFSALRHPFYRRFWWGGLVSLTGSWIQITAQQWLVYDLTGSALMLGTVTFANTVPTMLLTLFGGAVADRSEKRHLLIGTQSVFMAVSVVLALLTLAGRIAVWHILVLSAVSGMAAALDMPSRQSLIPHLVGREDLANAIALNSAVFNGSRIIGPAVAGLIIEHLGPRGGPGWSFAINAASYLAVIAALATIAVDSRPAGGERQPVLQEVRDGVAFALGHSTLRGLLGLLAVAGTFGISFTVLMPVFARDVLHVAARGFGMLLTASGIGATIGVLALATARPARPIGVVAGTFAGFVALLAAFAASPAYPLSLLLMVGVSGMMTSFLSATNTVIQGIVPDALRGRVMSLYVLASFGTAPLGGLLMGSLASLLGAREAVLLGAGACAAAVLIFRAASRDGARRPAPRVDGQPERARSIRPSGSSRTPSRRSRRTCSRA
ncbi:MAG: MFS transporter [Armatimonadota bacterium]|nr:MFS transporter [Armatimonadota bacterium]MDR7518566.1 MFS transporter [Armatimonadota bacterium]MDR7551160.1 MFS transporter [Armatimonadota bacterium]